MPKANLLSDNEIEAVSLPLVKEIFLRYHPQCGGFIRETVIDRLLGIDWILKDTKGKVVLLGSKIRRPRYAHNVDLTIEEYNNPTTLQVGDLYNSRMDEYLYGFLDDDCTCLTKWIYIYFQPVVSLVLNGMLPYTRQYNVDHGRASFVAIKSFHIPTKYIIGYKGFPIMESYSPLIEFPEHVRIDSATEM